MQFFPYFPTDDISQQFDKKETKMQFKIRKNVIK